MGDQFTLGRDFAFAAERELVAHQLIRAALVHDEHDHVGHGAADLKTDAAAFDAHVPRRRPLTVGHTAGHDAFSILRADNERALFKVGHDHDAVRLLEQILRNALVGRGHNFGHDVRRFVDPPRGAFFGRMDESRQSHKSYQYSHQTLLTGFRDPRGGLQSEGQLTLLTEYD